MTSPGPREQLLRSLRGQLHTGPLLRRRLLHEIGAHFDDLVAELRATGLTDAAAAQETLRRLGDPETIATAFEDLRFDRPRWSRVRSLRSPAWIVVGAMSAVTAWAAEMPQASGAKATTRPASVLPAHHLERSTAAGHPRRHRPRS